MLYKDGLENIPLVLHLRHRHCSIPTSHLTLVHTHTFTSQLHRTLSTPRHRFQDPHCGHRGEEDQAAGVVSGPRGSPPDSSSTSYAPFLLFRFISLLCPVAFFPALVIISVTSLRCPSISLPVRSTIFSFFGNSRLSRPRSFLWAGQQKRVELRCGNRL